MKKIHLDWFFMIRRPVRPDFPAAKFQGQDWNAQDTRREIRFLTGMVVAGIIALLVFGLARRVCHQITVEHFPLAAEVMEGGR